VYHRVLTAAEVLTLYGGGSGTKTPADDISNSNLITHYDFQETSGTTLTDRVGSNNGSLSGTADLTNDGVFATPATSDLPENTLFEETDTYKTYWLQSGEWKLKPFESYSAQNDNDATNGTSICNTRDFLGIRIVADSPLIGKVVSSVTWKIGKIGSPTTNNILGRIYSGAANAATGTIEATSTNTILVSTVTNGDEVTLNFNTSYALEENSAIMFGLDSTSSGNDCASAYITFRYLSNTTNNTDFRYTQWAGLAFEDGDTGYSTWVKID
jgi:hypothetical protein